MAGLFFRAKPKRVTATLGDEARARIVGAGDHTYASSGSEHSAADSPCLSDLVHGFLEEDSEAANWNDPESDGRGSVSDSTDRIEEALRSSAAASNGDPYRNLLLAHASSATERFSSSERGVLLRGVMRDLRDRGHNAAVCKTRWEASGGLAAGTYEFIDVVKEGHRYVVDVDFASEFHIARPTSEYATLLQSLPEVFVGRSEDLKSVVRITCDAGRRSLRSSGLSVPPWRMNRYMQQKWFGPYRRTTNPVPTPTTAVQCRYVGFEDASNSRLFAPTRSSLTSDYLNHK